MYSRKPCFYLSTVGPHRKVCWKVFQSVNDWQTTIMAPIVQSCCFKFNTKTGTVAFLPKFSFKPYFQKFI